MEIEKTKTKSGEIKFFKTKEASFNIETIKPRDKFPTFYLKRNTGGVIIIKGHAGSSKGKLKEKDFIKIKPKEKFWIKNNTNKEIKYLAVDIHPAKEKDIVC